MCEVMGRCWLVLSVALPPLTLLQGYLVLGAGRRDTLSIAGLCAMCLACGELLGWWLQTWREELDAPDDPL